jgi:hypothetical protein
VYAYHHEERRAQESSKQYLTMVILFLLLGVSAKHFIEEVSTTVSQNVTTGSATCVQTR